MLFAVLRDVDLTKRVLEATLDSPNGRRSLSRLARTCRTFCEPALNVLWRELDSFAPLAGLFPNLMKKAHKPSLGLVKAPGKDDWDTFNKYNERVRRITYDERSNAIVASIFPMLAENRPQEYILPFLEELTWKVQTPTGLNYCEMFLNPTLQTFNLEIAVRLPQLDSIIQNLSKHTRLTTFSFISPTTLPESFTNLLHNQNLLEKVVLVAPGALSPNIGRWLASLEHLTQLQLDLSGRGEIAVEGFFDELIARSGYSSPSSVASSDDELDFSAIRRSTLKLTGDLPPKKVFHQLRRLQLTGEAANIAVFLRNITSPLTHMDFAIEDPPDKADWQDLCALICERFGDSLLSLRIVATSSSRFADLMRSTPRGEPASNRLSLEYLTSLPNLVRFEIDLPESIIFTSADLARLAQSAPRLELLKLCPLARFPADSNTPKITFDDLAVLLQSCRNIHTVSAVFNAKPIQEEILKMRQVSSNSLLRLNVGHSWISDPLQVAISLSHIAPRLETLKWFQEKTRQGYIQTNSKNWQSLSDFLPHFQNIRLVERGFVSASPKLPRREKVDKCVGVTTSYVDRSIDAQPFTVNSSVQAAPQMMDRAVEAGPTVFSVSVDATPVMSCASVDATTTTQEQGVDTTDILTPEEPPLPPAPRQEQILLGRIHPLALSYIFNTFSLFYRIFFIYPFAIPSRILHFATSPFRTPSQGRRLPTKLPHNGSTQHPGQNGVAHNGTKAMKNGDIVPLNTVRQ
ncbi:hypothetical protein JOM56_006421 [Amanita muscaria]